MEFVRSGSEGDFHFVEVRGELVVSSGDRHVVEAGSGKDPISYGSLERVGYRAREFVPVVRHRSGIAEDDGIFPERERVYFGIGEKVRDVGIRSGGQIGLFHLRVVEDVKVPVIGRDSPYRSSPGDYCRNVSFSWNRDLVLDSHVPQIRRILPGHPVVAVVGAEPLREVVVEVCHVTLRSKVYASLFFAFLSS